MKRLFKFLPVLSLVVLIQACNSEETANSNTEMAATSTGSHNESQDEKAVQEAVDRLSRAMESADSSALYELTSPKLSYGHSSGKVEDQQTYISNILNGNSDFVKIATSEQEILLSGNTAVVRHRMIASTSDHGRTGEVNIKILLVWQNQDGNWKLIARQAVK